MKALKWGCGGCAVIILLLLLAGGGAAGLGWMQAKDVNPEPHRIESVPSEHVQTRTITAETPASSLAELVVITKGVDLALQPAEAGTAFIVESEFDERFYEFEHQETIGEDGAPRMTVRIEATGSGLVSILRQIFTAAPKLTVQVPADAYGKLVIDSSGGEAIVNLTGLEVVDVDIESAEGAMIVKIEEPTPYAYRQFRLRGAMGAAVVGGLGNASPAVTILEQSMGALVVDASGAWRNDGTLSMETSMGSGTLTVPKNIVVEGLDGITLNGTSTDPEVPLPVLKIETSASQGDIQIRRK